MTRILSVVLFHILVSVAGLRTGSALISQAIPPDSIGRVRLVVSERSLARSQPPVLVLGIETVRQYPCLGFGIENSFTQRGETLLVNLVRVVPPGGICSQAIRPATLNGELHLAPARYALLVTQRSATDIFTLSITDSSTALASERMSYVEADTRVRWRFPRRSFALFCGSVEVALPLCTDVREWLTRQKGISPVRFSAAGLNPYRPEPSRNPDENVDVFTYTQEQVLDVVRRCFAEVEGHIREAVGAFLTIRTWTGDQINALSRRAYHETHIPVPEQVTAGPACAGNG